MFKPYYKVSEAGYSGKWVANHLFGYKHTEFIIRKGDNPYMYFCGFLTIGLFGYNYSIAKNPISFLIFTRIRGAYRLWRMRKNQQEAMKRHSDFLNKVKKTTYDNQPRNILFNWARLS